MIWDWVTGQLNDGSRVTKCDPLSGLLGGAENDGTDLEIEQCTIWQSTSELKRKLCAVSRYSLKVDQQYMTLPSSNRP